MSQVQIHLPDSLQEQLESLASRDGITVDQFIATAVAEKLASLLTESYLEQRAHRASREKFDAALGLVPEGEPLLDDRLPDR